MLSRSLLAALALTTAATDSEAGPFRRRAQPTYQSSWQPAYQPTNQPVYQSSWQPAYQPTHEPAYQPSTVTPTAVIPAGAIVTSPSPAVTPATTHVSGYAPADAPAVTATGFPAA